MSIGLLGIGLVLAGVLSLPVLAASPALPALVRPASSEHHVGKPIYLQLVTPDLAAAERFYAGLFGWTFQNTHLGTAAYAQASLDGQVVGGMLQRKLPAGGHRRPAWLTFLAVRDADAASAAAVHAGATLLFGPRDAVGLGREAVLADPQGAVFAILASASGDPPDVLGDPGAWIWSSLLTADPAKDAAFYRGVFGYQPFGVPGEPGADHLILASETYARASVNPLPAAPPAFRPHWLNYIRVDDAAAMAAKVQALGGQVLVAPRVDRHGGRIALVSDPQGAPFGLMEWADDSTAEDAK